MALVKITMHVECDDDAEYLRALAKLETHAPSDGRFTTKTLAGDEATKIVQLVFEPTTQVV